MQNPIGLLIAYPSLPLCPLPSLHADPLLAGLLYFGTVMLLSVIVLLLSLDHDHGT